MSFHTCKCLYLDQMSSIKINLAPNPVCRKNIARKATPGSITHHKLHIKTKFLQECFRRSLFCSSSSFITLEPFLTLTPLLPSPFQTVPQFNYAEDDTTYERSCPHNSEIFPSSFVDNIRSPLKNMVENLCPKPKGK